MAVDPRRPTVTSVFAEAIVISMFSMKTCPGPSTITLLTVLLKPSSGR